MDWIQPLQLQTIIVNILSGDTSYFTIIALFFITGMAAYFRMNGLGLFFMIGVFLLLFSGFVTPSLIVLLTIFAGLLIGYWISKIIKN